MVLKEITIREHPFEKAEGAVEVLELIRIERVSLDQPRAHAEGCENQPKGHPAEEWEG